MYIDTHTHLFAPEFEADIESVIVRATESGVGKMIMPAISPESYDDMERLAARYPGILYPTIGLHPTEQGDMSEAENRLRDGAGRYVAIGECGLDMHWTPETIDRQTEILSRHFELSRTYGLPLIIHTREAFGPMIELLRRDRRLRGVMHGFAGTVDDYLAIKETGDFLFGIGGTVTFNNSRLPEAVAAMSLDDIVLETDSPYLSPVPHRGRRNESANIPLIAAKIAEIKGCSVAEVETATTANAERMFRLG
ncbi:MAG: TatD family hydrolase [Rikenellaceae bacterium]|nr:TatD family hydrolase [Rikenellaceae bacterium]